MAIELAKLKWGWVSAGLVLAFAVAYAGLFCVITVYASGLAFQVRGAPDTEVINQFAANSGEAIQAILIGLGTFVGGLVAARKAKVAALSHGLAVGFITALLSLVLSLVYGFSLWSLISLVLATLGGYLAGLVVQRRRA